MRHSIAGGRAWLAPLSLVVAVVLVVAPQAFSAKGGKKAGAFAIVTGPTLSIASQLPGEVTFAASATSDTANELYSLWVANLCDDADGVRVTAEYHAVVWDQPADPFPTTGQAGPFATDGSSEFAGPIESCSAYLWLFPDAWTPLETPLTYTP